jgi:hypothetical protein
MAVLNLQSRLIAIAGVITTHLNFQNSIKTYKENVRFEVFTAVAMKNAVSCDIKTQFVPHRKHVTSQL